MHTTVATPGKIVRTYRRPDGSEVKLTATAYANSQLETCVDYYAHRRQTPEQPWALLSKTPHPDWKQMPRADYVRYGRAEIFQALSHGEILGTCNLLKPTGKLH